MFQSLLCRFRPESSGRFPKHRRSWTRPEGASGGTGFCQCGGKDAEDSIQEYVNNSMFDVFHVQYTNYTILYRQRRKLLKKLKSRQIENAVYYLVNVIWCDQKKNSRVDFDIEVLVSKKNCFAKR